MSVFERGRWWWLLAALCLMAAALFALRKQEPPASRRVVVEIRAMAFHPARLEVAVGDTVVWVNRDFVPHTATAAGAWDTGVIAAGAEAGAVASTVGELTYTCSLHPVMRGWIVTRD
ncbi:MAG TPA: cupredoxin domain-containing protein [Gemmatimonadales bacterium]|nr:cupredoxin domain-containing protein [Gemmatimonadales bacterium]